jgi:hypothetical protein
MHLLIFVAAEKGVCVPLPSKLTSASAGIPAFSRVYRAVALQWIIPSRYTLILI